MYMIPCPERGYQRLEGDGDVILRMTRDDYHSLLIQLGFAAGGQWRDWQHQQRSRLLGLVNRLNAGNPDFTPYEIAEPAR